MLKDEAVEPHPTDVLRPAPRIGIVGAGFMGGVHARAARTAGARIAAVVASSAPRLDAAVAAVGAESGYVDLDRMLERSDIDVVHVCVPNALHVEVAMRAIQAGKHVIVEKPLATSARDAALLTAAAERAGIIAAVPFVYRFHPMVREMRERVLRGDAGQIGLVHGSYLQDWLAGAGEYNWRVDRSSGGPSRTFADIGSHWFDLLEFVSGSRVARLSARMRTVAGHRLSPEHGRLAIDTEDTVTVQFETEAGVIGTFCGSQVARGRKNRLALEISGSAESFAFDQERAEHLWVGDAEGHRVIVRDPKTLSGAAARYATLPSGHAQGYQECFNAFVGDTYAAVAGRTPDGLPSFEDGSRSATIVEAVLDSVDSSGAWIELPTGRKVAA